MMAKERISNQQLSVMVMSFVLGSSVVFSPAGIGPSALVAFVLGFMEGALVACLFIWLALLHPGQTYVEIAESVFGRFLGTLFSALYLWFLFQLGGLVLQNFADFFEISLMPSSPLLLFLLSLGLACAYAAFGGIEVIARATVILLFLTVAVFIVTGLLSFNIADTRNLFPLLDVPLVKLAKSSHGIAMFPFAETVAFLMVFPSAKDRRALLPSTLKGLALGGLILLLAMARNIAVLGPAYDNMTFPALAAATLIEVGDIFSRLEITVAINFLSMGFVYVSLVLYGAAKGLGQLLRLKSYQPLVLPLALLMVLLGQTGFRHGFAEIVAFATDTWPIYAPIFTIAIPLVTLVLALLRRKRGNA